MYYPGLSAPFYLDDTNIILHAKSLPFNKLDIGSIFSPESVNINRNRIVSNITLGLSNHFYGLEAKGYRYLNIFLHILNSILLFQFIKATLFILRPKADHTTTVFTAFSATLLWLAHPVQTQAVTYIIQRMTLMATCFFLLSLLFYIKGRLAGTTVARALHLTACVISGFLALGSKEIAATLPFFILLYEWFFFQEARIDWLWNRRYFLLGILLVLALISLVYTKGDPLSIFAHGYALRDFTLKERLLTESRVILFYLSLLVFPSPSRLSLEHDFSLSTSLFSPVTTLFSILFIVLCLMSALLMARRQRLFSFIILWFFGNLVIESTIVPLELVFEHRLYLPSALLFIPVPLALLRVFPKKYPAIGLVIMLTMLFSTWTWQRNRVWADPLLFKKNNVVHAPASHRARNDYGQELLNRGFVTEGFRQLDEAIRLNPEYFQAHYNYGMHLTKLGDINRAITHLKKAIQIRPHSDDAHNNLGIAYGKKGDFRKALREFDKALEINPQNSQAAQNRKMVLSFLGTSVVQ
ncbi:MAG: membrane protein [Desulfobulbaceae bacterium]